VIVVLVVLAVTYYVTCDSLKQCSYIGALDASLNQNGTYGKCVGFDMTNTIRCTNETHICWVNPLSAEKFIVNCQEIKSL
jgi:hypothetical protein